jgi:hypothetical protein
MVKYGYTPLDIVLKLNFPLAIPWAPVLYLTDLTFSTSRSSGTPVTVMFGVLDLCILATVALFWYFVVAEVQERSRGSSLIRFSRLSLEIPKTFVLATVGAAAIAFACWDGHRLLLTGTLNRSALYWNCMIRAVVGGLFLVAWALILIKASIQDLGIACRRKAGTDGTLSVSTT